MGAGFSFHELSDNEVAALVEFPMAQNGAQPE